MKISFCITTHNRIKELKQAISSILGQTDLHKVSYELLISDDSTNDETYFYVNELSKNNTNIRYLKNREKGQFNNLNNLINESKNEWIVFLHDDDFLNNCYLEKVLDALSKTKTEEISVIWGTRNLIDKNGNIFNTLASSKKSKNPFVEVESKTLFYQMMGDNDYTYKGLVVPPMVTGIMVKKDLVEKVMFDGSFIFNADGLFLWKIFFLSDNSLFIKAPIVNYRWTEDSERAKPSELGIVFDEMKKMLLVMLEYMEETKGSRKKFLDNFYYHSVGINGSVTFLALRYKGSYLKRVEIIWNILVEVIKNYPKCVLSPNFYLSAAVGVTPKPILKLAYHIYMRLAH